MTSIYLDYASTTPTAPSVVETMLPYFTATYTNPSAMHHSGRQTARVMAEARTEIANLLGATTEEIIFTGSGTESDNLAIYGVAHSYKNEGKHIITTAIEHKAVLEAVCNLEKSGFSVTIIPVDKTGQVDPEAVMSAIKPETILISVMLGNNEIGTVQPVKIIADKLAEYRQNKSLPLLHTDACQAAGYLPLKVNELGVDLLTLNGSKLYGPKGIGVLYKRNAVRITPLLVGGGQENHYRAGTESVALMVGLATAFKEAEIKRSEEVLRLNKLRAYFKEGLLRAIPEIIINGHPTEVLPHILHVTLPQIEGESILLQLDSLGIEVATGSACSTHDLKPSYVLQAIGQADDLIHGSIRFSLGRYTTIAELDRVLEVFPAIVSNLKQTSVLTTKYYDQVK